MNLAVVYAWTDNQIWSFSCSLLWPRPRTDLEGKEKKGGKTKERKKTRIRANKKHAVSRFRCRTTRSHTHSIDKDKRKKGKRG